MVTMRTTLSPSGAMRCPSGQSQGTSVRGRPSRGQTAKLSQRRRVMSLRRRRPPRRPWYKMTDIFA